MNAFRAATTLIVTLGISLPVLAETQWLQWGGPNADFSVDGTGLAKTWPADGPKKIWSRPLGDGYSSITTDGKNLYTMYWKAGKIDNAEGKSEKELAEARRTGHEVVIAMDADTGKTKWEYEYQVSWPANMETTFGPGPNSTPLVSGDRLFTVGSTVKLHCIDRNTGKVIWQHDLVEKYGAATMQYGYGATPFPYENTILLPVGGPKHGIVCFSMKDGSVLWEKQNFAPCWATPLLIKLDGQDQVVVGANQGIAGLDPKTGELLWQHQGHKGSYITTPVWGPDNTLFVSAAYGVGARGIKLKREGDTTTAEELWYNPKVKFMHCTAVRDGNIVYGSSGDFGPTLITATNIKTGELLWRKRGFSKANCLRVGHQLVILDEDGNLALATPTKDNLEIIAKVKLCQRQSWTCPTVSGTKMFVRDRKNLFALDIGAGG